MGSQRVGQTEHVCTHAKTKVRPEMPTKNGHKESSDECLAFQIPRSHRWWNQVQTLDVRLISTSSISSPGHTPNRTIDHPLLSFTNLLCLECLPHHPRLNSVCLISSHPPMSSAYGFSINAQENNFFPPDMWSILFVLIHTTYHSRVLKLFVSRRFLTPTTSRVLRVGQCPIYLLSPPFFGHF